MEIPASFSTNDNRPSTPPPWIEVNGSVPYYSRQRDTMTSSGHLIEPFGLDGNELPWVHRTGHSGFGVSPYSTSIAGYMGPHGNVGLDSQARSVTSSSLFSPAHHALNVPPPIRPNPIPFYLRPEHSAVPGGLQSSTGSHMSFDLAGIPTPLKTGLGVSRSAVKHERNIETTCQYPATVNTSPSWQSVSSDVCYHPSILLQPDGLGGDSGERNSKLDHWSDAMWVVNKDAEGSWRRVNVHGEGICEDSQNNCGREQLDHSSDDNSNRSVNQDAKL